MTGVMFPYSEVLLAIHLVLQFTKYQAFSKAGEVYLFSLMSLIPALGGIHIAHHCWYTRAKATMAPTVAPPPKKKLWAGLARGSKGLL